MPLSRVTPELIDRILESYGPSLGSLNLAKNDLVVVEELHRLTSLTNLNISDNQLVDISGLAPLTSIQSLCLARNNITDISSLESLLDLRVLDLSENKLENIQAALEVISRLPNLRSLILEGNPLCVDPRYPFAFLQPSLRIEKLDERPVDEYQKLPPNQPPSPAPTAPVVLLPQSPAKEIESSLLREECRALRRVLELQEEAIGKEEVDGEGTATRVLKLWRENVFDLLVEVEREKLSSEGEKRKALETLRMEREEFGKGKVEMKILEEKKTALEAQVGILQIEVGGLKKEVEGLLKERKGLKVDLEREKEGKRGVVETVVETGEIWTRSENGLMDALRALDAYRYRIEVAIGHIELLKGIMERKEVTVRNEMAALEADKRLWKTEREKREMEALQLNGRDRGAKRNGDEGMPFWGLRAECEALMRAVFQRLDSNRRGAVSGRRLMEVLKSDKGVSTVMGNWVGSERWLEGLRCIEEGLGETEEDVTWGEFLLFFVPGGRKTERKTVNIGDIREDEALLELKVPEYWRGKEASGLQGLGLKELRTEVTRLARERAYLMACLKEESAKVFRRGIEVSELYRNERQMLLDRMKKAEDEVQRMKEGEQRTEERWMRVVREKERANEDKLVKSKASLVDTEEAVKRLEAESAHLRKENSKLMVTQRAMERELKRIKELKGKEEEEKINQLELKLEGALVELAAVKKERNSILSSLRELQRLQVRSPRKPAVMLPEREEANISDFGTSNASGSQAEEAGESQGRPERIEGPRDSVLKRLEDLEALSYCLMTESSEDEGDDN